VNRNKEIIIGIGVIVALVIIGGVISACWQCHQDQEFTKHFQCQKLGDYFYYNPATNECLDGSYCIAHPDDYWCK